jgi:hypothetical protein
MDLKCVLGAPISFLLLLFSCFYFTAKSQRLRREHNGLRTQSMRPSAGLIFLNHYRQSM